MRRTSLVTSALNVLLRPTTAGMRTPDRTFDALVAKAERKTRADAATALEFVDDLRFLLHSFASCPGLSPMGWQSVVSDIGVRLENRLRIDRLIRQTPEIEDEPIEDPVIITGLPRTATTLAHNILAGSAGHRGPALWELLFTDIDRGEGAARAHIEDTRKMARAFMRLAPAFRVIHPLDAEKPDECNYLLPHGSSHLARADMPDYNHWQRDRDYLPDYVYLRRAVQVLQYGRARRRWILKSPMHLAHLPEILAVFPGATIVWTHRDPAAAIGSVCSMVETTQALHVRRPDPHAIGRTWLELQASAVEQARAARAAAQGVRFVDVPYAWLAAEPHARMPELYDRIGATWTDRDAGNLDAVLARAGAGRSHEYELSRYGLTAAGVGAAFGDYSEKYCAV
ncbi:sulfotransferase family protein [Promicromonospora panici]|uniref:sulfotransferase family protein n=1 Tax=Promicromonospora panici TaxID=2219658 RepID=UPI0013ECEEB2|nr:sulfotransferase [Promicromonospora panici]